MARRKGRNIQLTVNSAAIAVMNTHTIAFAYNPVDVTGYTDSGFVTYLTTAGSKQMTFDASGFVNGDALKNYMVDTGTFHFADCVVEWLADDDSGDVIYGMTVDLVMSNYTENGSKDGAMEFSASFASSGSWVKNVIP